MSPHDDARTADDAGVPNSSSFDTAGIVRPPGGGLWYDGHPETFTAVLRDVVERSADSTAVVDADGVAATYGELWDRASRIAGGLRRAGVRVGDRVAIDLPNSVAWGEALIGALLAGAVAVPLDQRGSPDSRRAVLRDADVRLLLDDAGSLPSGPAFVHQSQPADLAQLLYTSGTTGEPKGVMANHRNLASFSEITRRTFRLGAEGSPPLRNLVAIPLSHAAGCNAQFLPTLGLGGMAILTASSKPADIVATAAQHEPTMMLAVPAVYKLLLQRERAAFQRLTSLRWITYGAAPVAKSLIDELHEAMPETRLGNAFGMTEISNMATYLPDECALSHHDSVGFPVPGVEVDLRDVDDTGQGHLYLRGPNMAQGYWRKKEQTAETFEAGWVRSGDIAFIGPDGLVYLRDRAKDVINRGGEKIYSLEVENVILTNRAVDEVAVVPVADDVMGEKVGAIVVISPGSALDEQQLVEHVAARLPRYAVPEHVVLRTEALPRGGTGKVLKDRLRRELGWG